MLPDGDQADNLECVESLTSKDTAYQTRHSSGYWWNDWWWLM